MRTRKLNPKVGTTLSGFCRQWEVIFLPTAALQSHLSTGIGVAIGRCVLVMVVGNWEVGNNLLAVAFFGLCGMDDSLKILKQNLN